MVTVTSTDALKSLWIEKFFNLEKTFEEISTQIGKQGCNPTDQSLWMALRRASYLARRGRRGSYTFIQKFPSKAIVLSDEVLPDKLIDTLGTSFENEVHDLRMNYGHSGTCTAFLLRKILEKLIFVTFAKSGLGHQLEDLNHSRVGLGTMIQRAVDLKVNGKPFLMPKTGKAINGIKFLGDTSAHNPLTNVDMKTIIPQMPFIVTAYEELAAQL